jgi:shikimate kinase
VIAVGGGAVLDPENLIHLLRLGKMLYLKCPKEILKQRTHSFFQDFEKMYSIRKPKYETIPSTWIETEKKSEQEVLEAIWQVINLDKSSGSPHGENPMAKPLE